VRAFIIYLLFIQQVFAIDCHEGIKNLLKKSGDLPLDEVQYKLLKQVQKLEKRTNKLRVKKSNSEPAINLKIWKKIAHYDALIANDSYSQVTRELRPLFREVESAVVIMNRYEKIIKTLTETSFENSDELVFKLKDAGIHQELADAVAARFISEGGDLSKMKAYYKSVIDESSIHMGHFYHEYKLIRKHLEGILEDNNCDTSCVSNTRNLLNSIGVKSFTDQESFYVLLKGAETPTWKELNQSLNAHPLAFTTRLKRERDEEFKLFWKGLFYELLPTDELANLILKTPGLNKSKAIRVIRLIYDRVARLVHFPKINRIMRSPLQSAEKFDLLLSLNTTVVPEDELLVTFARRIDSRTKDTWEELHRFAKNNQERYPDILKRMDNAKEKAMARGEISLIHEKSFTTKLAIILSAGGSIAYYYFNKKEVEEVIEDLNLDLESDDSSDEELMPTDEEVENFDIDGSVIRVQIGSREDKELDQIIEDIVEATKDIKIDSRSPDSKNIFIIPLRLIKEI